MTTQSVALRLCSVQQELIHSIEDINGCKCAFAFTQCRVLLLTPYHGVNSQFTLRLQKHHVNMKVLDK